MLVLVRGAVVARDHRYGVVWTDDGKLVVLLPILAPKRAFRHDIALDLPDLLSCGAPIADAVIRPRPVTADRHGHVQVGAAPGALMCRVSQALVRIACEQQFEGRWQHDRAHRVHAHQNGFSRA